MYTAVYTRSRLSSALNIMDPNDYMDFVMFFNI